MYGQYLASLRQLLLPVVNVIGSNREREWMEFPSSHDRSIVVDDSLPVG